MSREHSVGRRLHRRRTRELPPRWASLRHAAGRVGTRCPSGLQLLSFRLAKMIAAFSGWHDFISDMRMPLADIFGRFTAIFGFLQQWRFISYAESLVARLCLVAPWRLLSMLRKLLPLRRPSYALFNECVVVQMSIISAFAFAAAAEASCAHTRPTRPLASSKDGRRREVSRAIPGFHIAAAIMPPMPMVGCLSLLSPMRFSSSPDVARTRDRLDLMMGSVMEARRQPGGN